MNKSKKFPLSVASIMLGARLIGMLEPVRSVPNQALLQFQLTPPIHDATSWLYRD